METTNTKKKRVRELRKLILVHSYIYYVLYSSTISDAEFDRYCAELVELQKEKKVISEPLYHHDFHDFEGFTGFYFKYKNKPEIVTEAKDLVGNGDE